MHDGFRAVDADMHVLEPADLWERYIEPAFRERAPRGHNRFSRDALVTIDGMDIGQGRPTDPVSAVRARKHQADDPIYAEYDALGWGPESQMRAMDREGLDVAVLFPSRSLFTVAIDGMDPALAAAICRAYNDWMGEFVAAHPDRLYGAAQVSPHDVDSAVTEVRRCVERFGFKAVFLRPNVMNGRPWHDRSYDPLWAECERLDVPVCFHEGGKAPQIAGGHGQIGWQFSETMLRRTCSHPMGQMMAVISFCGGGVFELFPRLRAAFLEGNCSWVPWLLWRLDEQHEWLPTEIPELTMKPSDYFKRQGFASMDCDEALAGHLHGDGYGHTVVFSTDYPHEDAKFPNAVETLVELGLPEAFTRSVLWDNPARLYALG
jgi:predicted TIM-barrel fold metal-dependent hydrolase